MTRQLVGAVEQGRHTPNVSAALALARALGTTVEALFEEPAPPIVAVPGELPVVGQVVQAARVGDSMVAVPAWHGVVNRERWAVGDAVVTDYGLDWLPDSRRDGVVIAGCDPLLGLLGDLVERSSGHRVLPVHASSGRAIDALRRGHVHGIVVHAASGAFPEPPLPVACWHLARWQVGLAATASAAVPSLEELAGRRVRVVQRDAGAGTQQALERALVRAGLAPSLPGPVGDGHLDVARRIDAGGARVGVTMEAAARAFGLGFAPLEEHDVELWVDRRWSGLPAMSALGDAVTGASFARRAGALAGYDLRGCGARRDRA